jgi:hypothetical protein
MRQHQASQKAKGSSSAKSPFAPIGWFCADFQPPPVGLSNPTEAFACPNHSSLNGVWVPRVILAIRSKYAVPLYLELRRHCFETPTCFPDVRRLARLVGCATGTVSALTDQFHALGIVTKTHDGRRCVYRFAKGCWRQRKSRKSVHCSANRTEDRSNFVESTDRAKNQKTDVSLERRAKRSNMIVTLRRWVQLSPAMPDIERG